MLKNVPEKRNIGTITKRCKAEKDVSVSCLTANAAIGAAHARPSRRQIGTAQTASPLRTPPNAAITARYVLLVSPIRVSIHSRWPAKTSPTVSGVASMASYIGTHLTDASTG